MIALGIDPGTSRWAYVFLEDGKLVKEGMFVTEDVKRTPGLITDLFPKADIAVAPSGYGSPLKRVSELSEDDFREILLKREGENQVVGLEKVLRAIKRISSNAYVISGVKLLQTVSEEKKHGKIDMGTPDKVCVAAAAIEEQASRLRLHYRDTNFVLAEIGYGFDAFLCVKNGKIIDGIGGTIATSTSRGEDGEIIYLRGEVNKDELKKKDISPKKVAEGAINDINKLRRENDAAEIIISGSQSPEVISFLRQSFKNIYELHASRFSNAAYGAALIADGIGGGRFKELVQTLAIKDARGSNLDYVTL